jgi:chromosome segregation ATPase
MKDQIDAARGEVKNAVERFDFEGKGLEAVSQRVADLRSALSEFEGRYRGLTESASTVRELLGETSQMAPKVSALREDVAKIEQDAQELAALRRTLASAVESASSLVDARRGPRAVAAGDRVGAVRRVALAGTHASVKDAIEQARLAHTELGRMFASQAETREWLLTTERQIASSRRCGELSAVRRRSSRSRRRPAASAVDRRDRVAPRDARAMHARLGEFGALAGTLDERGRALISRMDAAEQRFVQFASHAEEAERIGGTVTEVVAGIKSAEHRTEVITKSVKALEARCASVEELADRSRKLHEEMTQQASTLEASAKELNRASKLREQASTTAAELEAIASKLDESLGSATAWSAKLEDTSSQLEDRAAALGKVDTRLTHFEKKLSSGDRRAAALTALDQIARARARCSRSADMERMFTVAESTHDTSGDHHAHRETTESRESLETLMSRLERCRTSRARSTSASARSGAEDRLASRRGFLAEVRSGLETLQGQKTLVDQAVERVSALRFLLKQADAMIEGLRDERKMTADVQEAMDWTTIRPKRPSRPARVQDGVPPAL